MLTQEIVRELLHYNPETGVLTWKERGSHWFTCDRLKNSWNTQHAGMEAGKKWKSPNSRYVCRYITIMGKGYKAHRLAWQIMLGDEMPSQIDHKNQNAMDNRWDNLRASSCAENRKNVALQSNNTSGVSGVHWHKQRGKWQARGKAGGVHKHLGLFEDMKDAENAVLEFRAANGFFDTHGRNPLSA